MGACCLQNNTFYQLSICVAFHKNYSIWYHFPHQILLNIYAFILFLLSLKTHFQLWKTRIPLKEMCVYDNEFETEFPLFEFRFERREKIISSMKNPRRLTPLSPFVSEYSYTYGMKHICIQTEGTQTNWHNHVVRRILYITDAVVYHIHTLTREWRELHLKTRRKWKCKLGAEKSSQENL